MLLWVLAHSYLALCKYEILMFPQQNLVWLKFSFGRVLYYGNGRILLRPAESLMSVGAQLQDTAHKLCKEWRLIYIPKRHQVNLGLTIGDFSDNWYRYNKGKYAVCPYLYASWTASMCGSIHNSTKIVTHSSVRQPPFKETLSACLMKQQTFHSLKIFKYLYHVRIICV